MCLQSVGTSLSSSDNSSVTGLQAGLQKYEMAEVAQVVSALVALIQRASKLYTEHKRQVRATVPSELFFLDNDRPSPSRVTAACYWWSAPTTTTLLPDVWLTAASQSLDGCTSLVQPRVSWGMQCGLPAALQQAAG